MTIPAGQLWLKLCSHVADQVNVVIEVAYKVIRNIMCCSASVPDELPFRHFVFDVGAGQVNGQQDQTVAKHINSICREMILNCDQTSVTISHKLSHKSQLCVA